MKKEHYLIGDLANLMGMSRDTLRYYEKRGLITSQKGNNGYRYYSSQEVSKLSTILYQRKMNISLNDMSALSSGTNTILDLNGLMQERLMEEEKALRQHRQTIARLKLTQADCQNFARYKGSASLRDFPQAYVIVPCTEFSKATEIWFELAKKHSGLDMTYLFDEYEFSEPAETAVMSHKNTQLILYQHLESCVDYPLTEQRCTLISPFPCLYSCSTSQTRIPDSHAIQAMTDYAKTKDIPLSNRLHATYTMQGIWQGQHTYYQEIYIPLKKPRD